MGKKEIIIQLSDNTESYCDKAKVVVVRWISEERFVIGTPGKGNQFYPKRVEAPDNEQK